MNPLVIASQFGAEFDGWLRAARTVLADPAEQAGGSGGV